MMIYLTHGKGKDVTNMQLQFENEGKKHWTVWGRYDKADKFDLVCTLDFDSKLDTWVMRPGDLNNEVIELEHTLKESISDIREMFK